MTLTDKQAQIARQSSRAIGRMIRDALDVQAGGTSDEATEHPVDSGHERQEQGVLPPVREGS